MVLAHRARRRSPLLKLHDFQCTSCGEFREELIDVPPGLAISTAQSAVPLWNTLSSVAKPMCSNRFGTNI